MMETLLSGFKVKLSDHYTSTRTRIDARLEHWTNRLCFELARKRGIALPSVFADQVANVKRMGDDPIGRGGFADVWRGEDDNPQTKSRFLALKVFKQFDRTVVSQEDLKKALYKEATLWKMLDNPNIVTFSGVVHIKDPDERLQGLVALASPWMKHGNLKAYVGKHPSADRTILLAQATRGLIYLHSIDIIHGDLKCSNILVNDEGEAQLADFGLSTISEMNGITTGSFSNSAGHPRWLAPELMLPGSFGGSGKCTRETDVYALGMTALELFTERIPFFDLPEVAIPFEVVINGLRPLHPGCEATSRGLTNEIWTMMEDCWSHEPNLRPKTNKPDSKLVEFSTCYVARLKVYPPVCIYTMTSEPAEVLLVPTSMISFEDVSEGHIQDHWSDSALGAKLLIGNELIYPSGMRHSPFFACRVLKVKFGYGRETPQFDIDAQLMELRRKSNPHPNVAHIIGLCDILPHLKTGLVYDVSLEAEKLMDYLRRTGMVHRLGIMRDITNGLSHLHQYGITHGDMRTINIVVDNDILKLVDYGIPSYVRDGANSFEYSLHRAPEVLAITIDGALEKPTPSGDVYSLAISFYEILTESLPFCDSDVSTSSSQLLRDIASDGLRPAYPGAAAENRGLTAVLWALMMQCWSVEPEARPSACQVAEHIEQLQNTAYKYNWRFFMQVNS